MASSIAGTAVWRCPGNNSPPFVLHPFSRFPCTISLHLSWGSKQFFGSVGCLDPENVLPCQFFRPAKIRLVHTVNCQQRQEEPGECGGLVGSKDESVTQSRRVKGGDGTKALAVTEGVCIALAGASYTASFLQKSQQTSVVASSLAAPHVLSKFQDLSTWQVPALWAALVINALLRTMQIRSSSNRTERKWEEKNIKDFTADQRIGKLEDDVESVASIARMLSRHLEKLGVRFRVTRRTLRDPIQETATLALRTSEVVRAITTREDMLEAELRETRQELRETQQLLVSMQESQEKQLELLITAMTKTLRSQKAIEEKISKDSAKKLPGRTSKAASTGEGALSATRKSAATEGAAKSNFAETLVGLKEAYMKKVATPTKKNLTNTQAVGAERSTLNEVPVDNNRRKVTSSKDMPGKKIKSYKPDTSFTKEDFWANTPATSAAELSVEHEVVDYLTSTDRTSDAVSGYSDNPRGSGRLDSFFSGRKQVNSCQARINVSTQDYHNPLHAQGGGSPGGSGQHGEHTVGFGFSFDNGYGKDKWPSSEVSPEIGLGGTSLGSTNNWSNVSGGDSPSGSGSGSPRQSGLSSRSAWDLSSPLHSWYSASFMDCSSGSGGPRIGEGIINFVQAGSIDTDFMRDFKDGYVSS